MAGGDGGGGEVARPRPVQARGRRQHQAAPSLPLDVVLEIAVRSDPATLVRCAATCWEMRHRVADDAGLRHRLRLRHTDRFVRPLLRGHLILVKHYTRYDRRDKKELYLMDTTAEDVIKPRKVTSRFGSAPLASRDGLLLVRAAKELRVCEPATGRSQILPSEPTFPTDSSRYYYHDDRLKYVLLDGESERGSGAAGAIGRPFHLLLANLELSQHRRHLQIQLFSSEHGAWGPFTEIRIPNLYGSRLEQGLGKALVVGGAVHWLCLTDSGSYVIKLHVRSTQVTITELPESFPRRRGWNVEYLLVTTSIGGSPIVLVAGGLKISAWSQSKQTTKWKHQPQAVTNAEELVQFALNRGGRRPSPILYSDHLKLLWFTEKSGIVLVEMRYYGVFWLDLRTMEIVRWSDAPMTLDANVCCPYEIDLSSWVPTFNNTAL